MEPLRAADLLRFSGLDELEEVSDLELDDDDGDYDYGNSVAMINTSNEDEHLHSSSSSKSSFGNRRSSHVKRQKLSHSDHIDFSSIGGVEDRDLQSLISSLNDDFSNSKNPMDDL